MKEHPFHWPAGAKKTRQRQIVLQTLLNAEKPLSAREIYSQIENQSQRISLSTVYRILDFFLEQEMLSRTLVIDDDTALYQIAKQQHVHYAICMDCHHMIELTQCPVEMSKPALDQECFQVTGHRVEFYGYCADCQTKNQDES